jgi:hypothetical protein
MHEHFWKGLKLNSYRGESVIKKHTHTHVTTDM